MEKILIVDDSPVEIKIIRRHLGEEYEILEATSGRMALDIALKELPDLILLDIIMPEMDGFEVCRAIKSNPETNPIPVIFITAVSDGPNIVKGFEAGGQDYVVKPFYSRELCARIKVHLDLKKSKESLLKYAKEMESKNLELNRLLAKLEATAMTDFLTGLANRRNMIQQIKAEALLLKQNHSKATLILGDIDNFKQVNDTYGHECGDRLLKDIAELMKAVVPDEAVVSRWGGEEFLLLLPQVALSEGYLIAEQIREVIETAVFSYKGQNFSITLTLGLAEFDPELGVDESIKRADDALYKGKKTTKNCVISNPD